MEKKLYAIYHNYDEDGGFGDAVYGKHITMDSLQLTNQSHSR